MTHHTTDRDALIRRQQELLLELEQLEDVTDENDIYPEARIADLRRELADVERQLDPDAADRHRHSGRSDADVG
jgi:hypothetical protein